MEPTQDTISTTSDAQALPQPPEPQPSCQTDQSDSSHVVASGHEESACEEQDLVQKSELVQDSTEDDPHSTQETEERSVQETEIQRLLEEKKRELLQRLAATETAAETTEVAKDAEVTDDQMLAETIPSSESSHISPPSIDLNPLSVAQKTSSFTLKRTDEETSPGPDLKKTKVDETEHINQAEIFLGDQSDIVADSEQEDSCDIEFSDAVDYAAITGAWSEFNANTDNFLKGCKWSPDGSSVLTNSNDNCLRLFNLPGELYSGQYSDLPDMRTSLKIQEGELIYDYAWYPLMSSTDPASCCLVSSSRDTPIHMWDTLTGDLRCSYRAFDQMDELTVAHSLAFSLDGSKLYCGFNKMIRIFDITRPGKHCQKRPTFVKQGQSGIISCLAMNPVNPTMYAAGSYNRSVALYMEPNGQMYCMFQGQLGGVTHLAFSPDGNRLYTGGRKDSEILCWDIRNPGQILAVMNRRVDTNQRIYFDLDSTGRYLISGGTDGQVTAWDVSGIDVTTEGSENTDPVCAPLSTFRVCDDTVNGVGVHPTLPILATTTGQRHFPLPSGLDSSDSETEQAGSCDNGLRLHWLKQRRLKQSVD